MDFLALATDYDGTIAHDGVVPPSTVQALKDLRASGRKLLLVTGRHLENMLETFPEYHIFEWVVVENGALLYCPATRETQLLTEPVPPGFPQALRARGVPTPVVGRAIVATWHPHADAVLETIAELGIDWQVILNKDAVMALPSGVDKASGLIAALKRMKLSPRNVVAVGDAENDLPMLVECGCGVAVNNALEMVKAEADIVTTGDRGAGVEELIRHLLEDDLASLAPPGGWHRVPSGADGWVSS